MKWKRVLAEYLRKDLRFTVTFWKRAFSWTGYRRPMSYKYFKGAEINGLSSELVSKLDSARHVAGIPFRITSGKRSEKANEKASGVKDSSHLKGLAVDLGLSHWPAGYERNHARFLIVKGLLASGFTRIMIYSSHLHVDVDTEKSSETMPLGGESH